MLTQGQYEKCWNIFTSLKEEGLYLSHYQLAEETEIKDAVMWREFLIDPRVADYVATEMNLIRTAAINQMVAEAPKSRSVGQSQLINALQKIEEQSTKKEGPAFIYCYVPLNVEQKQAPNVHICNSDGVVKIDEGVFEVDI